MIRAVQACISHPSRGCWPVACIIGARVASYVPGVIFSGGTYRADFFGPKAHVVGADISLGLFRTEGWHAPSPKSGVEESAQSGKTPPTVQPRVCRMYFNRNMVEHTTGATQHANITRWPQLGIFSRFNSLAFRRVSMRGYITPHTHSFQFKDSRHKSSNARQNQTTRACTHSRTGARQ